MQWNIMQLTEKNEVAVYIFIWEAVQNILKCKSNLEKRTIINITALICIHEIYYKSLQVYMKSLEDYIRNY